MNAIDKAKEAAIARVESAKALEVLNPHIVNIAGRMLHLDDVKQASKGARDEAKEAGGTVYGLVKAAIRDAVESGLHPAALGQAFSDGLILSGVTPNTVRPYSSTLKLAVEAHREGRITLEDVESKDMTGLRNACKAEEDRLAAELRDTLNRYARELNVEELREVLELAGMYAEPRIAKKAEDKAKRDADKAAKAADAISKAA